MDLLAYLEDTLNFVQVVLELFLHLDLDMDLGERPQVNMVQ